MGKTYQQSGNLLSVTDNDTGKHAWVVRYGRESYHTEGDKNLAEQGLEYLLRTREIEAREDLAKNVKK